MDVTFTNGSDTLVVPGHFAADGDAADSGATSGDRWRAHFMPPRTGSWSYSVSFRSGTDIVYGGTGTTVAGIDGARGSFAVATSSRTGRDFRARGQLVQRPGERYLRTAGDGKVFIQGGIDCPENILAFGDFDATTANACSGDEAGVLHSFSTHVGDWKTGDPTWGSGKGKGLIGAVNYAASTGANSFYVMPMTRGGDDNRVFPWTGCDERLRLDVSKLEQWTIVLEHMNARGMLVHLMTQETENDQLLDGGALGNQRKLYYRELVSRFAHLPGLQWNLGEENTNTTAQEKEFATFFKATDPYRHVVFMHTYPGEQESKYAPLLGFEPLDGPTLQSGSAGGTHDATRDWIRRSAQAGDPWVVTATEMSGSAPTPSNPAPANLREEWMYGNVMAGGGGVEWYLKNGGGHSYDQTIENLREFDLLWRQSGHMVSFFTDIVQSGSTRLTTFVANDALTPSTSDWVLADEGDVYVIYRRDGGGTSLELTGQTGTFTVRWFDPRNGGSLQSGNVTTVTGGGSRDLGNPPGATNEDWLILVRR